MSSHDSSRTKAAPRLALDAMLNGHEGDVLRHAMWLDAANRAWRAHLPANLRSRLRLGSVKDGCLSALADTPAWAERARLDRDLLLNAARASGLAVREVKVRVARERPALQVQTEKPPTAASVAAVKNIMAILQRDNAES